MQSALISIAGNVFEEHCALAEYVAEDESQVSFKPGDKVLVMSKDQSGEGCGSSRRAMSHSQLSAIVTKGACM